MTLITDNWLSFVKKYLVIAVRGVFLGGVAVGLSACGGGGVDTAKALASLGSSESAASSSTASTSTTSGSTSGNTTSGGTTTPAPAPVAVSVNLSWNAPSTRLDNTAVVPADIGGYHVYFGTDQSSLQLLTDITDGAVMTYDTQTLSSGTYYFAVAAYDSNGAEGRLSNIAQKVI